MKHLLSIVVLGTAVALSACSQNETSRTVELLAAANVSPDRIINIDGTKNTRELGGYKTADGRRVKWGVLYRSDNLGELTSNGKAVLSALNLKAVTDLRSDPEREDAPDRLPEQTPPIKYTVLPINDEPVDIKALSRKILKGEVKEEELMTLLDHRRFITNPNHRKSWGDWVKSLENDANTPHLFHCTSGKDRAGYGAAITLLTLGVPKETVKKDFLLSNAVYADYIDKNIKKIERFVGKDGNTDLIRKVMGVSEETIDATFEQMEADYGSIDGFIENGLGIDAATRTRLQDKFLEPIEVPAGRSVSE